MPSVAVVILNYNGRNYLEQFLPFCIEHSDGHEVIVIDNASTDDSVSFLKQAFPSIRLIQLEENHGYAGGYNLGLEKVDSDYFVLLNSDVEVTENWIDPVIQLMEKNEQAIACQPKIKSFNQRAFFEYAGAAGGYLDYLGYPFCRGRIFGTLEEDLGQYNDNREIFWATGACLFVKSKAFFELGGLDERFFAHMEEIDFCWRAKNRGYSILYCGESTVYHVGGGTLSAENPKKTYLNFRNNLLMLHKNMNVLEFESTIKKRKFLDFIACLQFLLTGKYLNMKAVMKAHKDFKTLKNQYKAYEYSGLRHSEIYPYSIISAYFLKGIKKFSQIKIF